MSLNIQKEFLIPVPIKQQTKSRHQFRAAHNQCIDLLHDITNYVELFTQPGKPDNPLKPDASKIGEVKAHSKGEKSDTYKQKDHSSNDTSLTSPKDFDIKLLASKLNHFIGEFTKIEASANALSEPLFFYSINLPALVLSDTPLAKRLGFIPKDHLQTDPQYIDKEVSLRPVTPKIAVQMGLIRAFQVILQPIDPRNTHPTLGKKYQTLSYYSLNVSLLNLMDGLQDFTLEISRESQEGPPLKYKITKATEVRGKKNAALV
jgi:hypothetical protein